MIAKSEIETTIICKRCLEPKLADDFELRIVNGRWRRYATCISCHKTKRIRRISKENRHPILTLESKLCYPELFRLQNGLCRICHSPEKNGKKLSIDHCHETGMIRGLLCNKCNTGIGMFEDNPDLLRAAVAYLEKQNGERNKESSGQELLDRQSST